MKRFAVRVAGLCLLFASASAQDRAPDTLDVRQLTDGVWMHTSHHTLDDGTRVPSNGLIVLDGEGLLLVDTAWGVALTEELLDWIDEEIERPVTRAVATHFHDDRLLGAAALEARGIPLFAHPMTRALASADIPPPELLRDLAVGEAAAFGRAEVFYPGPAHTRDNVVVWLAKERILFGGCAIRPGSASGRGNVADADVKHWPKAVRTIQQRYERAEVVVPSHGEPGGVELLEHTIDLFDTK